jgi:hypothetical protein
MKRLNIETAQVLAQWSPFKRSNRAKPNARVLALGTLAFISVSILSARAQQPSEPALSGQMQGRVKILEEPGSWKLELLRQSGVLVAEGTNTIATGLLRLKTYRVEEITPRKPIRAEVDGKATQIDKAWRLTITGGPFRVRDAAPIIWIDDRAAGYGLESPDRKGLSVIVFDRARLRKGASISLSYGENDPSRTLLPEKLNISSSL